MQSHLKRIEVESVGRRDHDLAVHDAVRWKVGEQMVVQLGKIAIERAQVAALDEHVVVTAKDDGPKPVPFRLVEKAFTMRELVGKLGEHRLDGRSDREW